MLFYWADFRVDVPEKGVALDASYYLKDVVIDGVSQTIECPVDLFAYMKAKFVMQSSRTAFTEEQIANKDLYDFILEDLSVAQKTKEDTFKLSTKAGKYYFELMGACSEKDHAKIDWLLDILKEPNELFYKSSYIDKCMRLNDLQSSKPTQFVKAFENEHLETDSLLYRLEQLGIITKQGETYFYGDVALGEGKEARVFLQDTTKSAFVVKMKASLQEALKK
jgi:hypothetical protein